LTCKLHTCALSYLNGLFHHGTLAYMIIQRTDFIVTLRLLD